MERFIYELCLRLFINVFVEGGKMRLMIDKIKRVVVHELVARKLMHSDKDTPYILAGFRYDGEIRITDALPIEIGKHIQGLEEILLHRHLYPIEPDVGKEIFGSCPSCNVSGRYPLYILKEGQNLQAYDADKNPVKTQVTSF